MLGRRGHLDLLLNSGHSRIGKLTIRMQSWNLLQDGQYKIGFEVVFGHLVGFIGVDSICDLLAFPKFWALSFN